MRRRPRRRAQPRASLSAAPFARRALLFFAAAALAWAVLPAVGDWLARALYPRALPEGYRLLAHARGPTGRISVLQEARRGVRLLLSDHSVLGGKYVQPEFERETVFAQFHVHEAVRLARRPGEDEGAVGGRDGRALCLGLGIGVVANALHELGSSVDAVEIDPVVARFAARYFDVRGPAVHVRDGTQFLREMRARVRAGAASRYDYVVHDVFTGGAVPLGMFSNETFAMVRDVMQSDGVLALNFVGALDEPPGEATRAVAAVRARLEGVFEFVTAFAEDAESRIQNVVFFASDARERMTFRRPVERDFLGSHNRQEALETFERRRISEDRVPRIAPEQATDAQINAGQWITAREHWRSMRKILDKRVWLALAAADDREW